MQLQAQVAGGKKIKGCRSVYCGTSLQGQKQTLALRRILLSWAQKTLCSLYRETLCTLSQRQCFFINTQESIIRNISANFQHPLQSRKALLFKLILIFHSHSTDYCKLFPNIWKWDCKKRSYFKVFEKSLSYFWLTVQCKVRAEGKAPDFSVQLLLSY